jgi:hypothetical protein
MSASRYTYGAFPSRGAPSAYVPLGDLILPIKTLSLS